MSFFAPGWIPKSRSSACSSPFLASSKGECPDINHPVHCLKVLSLRCVVLGFHSEARWSYDGRAPRSTPTYGPGKSSKLSSSHMGDPFETAGGSASGWCHGEQALGPQDDHVPSFSMVHNVHFCMFTCMCYGAAAFPAQIYAVDSH